MTTTKLISIVDDDESIRDSTEAFLRSVGYRVATFASGQLFLDSEAFAEAECLILDIRMPDLDGLELQRRLKALGSCVRIIFVTARDDAASRQQAIEAGAVDFFSKPCEPKSLLAAVQAALSSEPRLSEGAATGTQ